MIPEKEARSLDQILETLESYAVQPTTQKPSPDFSGSSTPSEPPSNEARLRKRQNWQDKWLSMVETHPQVAEARNRLFKVCQDYSLKPERGRTVVIYGENGCGKTHLARCVSYWASRIAIKLPLVNASTGVALASVCFCNWPAIVDGFKRDCWEVIDDLEACSLMVLDDIGAEHDPSRIGVEKLYYLLNRREWKWNILTTNIGQSAWEDKFERRIASRLNRNAEHIDLSMVPDYSTV